MRFFRGAMKGALAAKAIQVVRREAAKPQNQRKARELVARLRSRGNRPGH